MIYTPVAAAYGSSSLLVAYGGSSASPASSAAQAASPAQIRLACGLAGLFCPRWHEQQPAEERTIELLMPRPFHDAGGGMCGASPVTPHSRVLRMKGGGAEKDTDAAGRTCLWTESKQYSESNGGATDARRQASPLKRVGSHRYPVALHRNGGDSNLRYVVAQTSEARARRSNTKATSIEWHLEIRV